MEIEITKICSKCGDIKIIDKFTKDRKSKDGHSAKCKTCKNAVQQLYKNLNRTSINEKERERNAVDLEYREKKAKRSKKYYFKLKENHPEYLIWDRAKKRAKSNRLVFDLEVEDIIIPEFCPLLGIKLQANSKHHGYDSPSLDKLDPLKGYIKGNIQVISFKANTMKQDATNEELLLFAKNIIKYINNEDIVQTIENGKSIEIKDKEPL